LVPACRASLTRGLTVFIFHDVTSSPSLHQRAGASYTPVDVFKRQLAWIKSRFAVVPPTALPQLGGDAPLPPNAALITFDDAWAGVFRTAIPLLRAAGVTPLCFLNMGTIEGDPDLAAVRRYEAVHPPGDRAPLGEPVGVADADALLSDLRTRYGDDPAFQAFQGPTATADDLAAVVRDASFGSHLRHHWDLRRISEELYERSFRENAERLSRYPNTLPAFATPHGAAGDDVVGVPLRNGARVVFVGTGAQNRGIDGARLDRVTLPGDGGVATDWWYATHRRRLVGLLAG
jgi:hypothetical protein